MALNRSKIALSVYTLGIAASTPVGIVGLRNYEHTPIDTQSEKSAKIEATTRFNRIHEAASPIGKFTLDYLRPLTVKAFKAELRNGEKKSYTYEFNTSCLSGTPYDVRTQKFLEGQYGGLLNAGEINGQLPSGASVEISDHDVDVLVVTPDAENFKPLELKGLEDGNYLVAANKQTSHILDARGCDIGLQA